MSEIQVEIVRMGWKSAPVQTLFELLQAEYMGIYGEADPDDNQLEGLEFPEGEILVAFTAGVQNSKPIGMIAWSCHPEFDDVALMRRTYTHWRGRRQGLGRQLVKACEASALAAGKTHMWLEHGTAQTAARALYSSMGYVPEHAEPFGHYAQFADTTSIFLGKELA